MATWQDQRPRLRCPNGKEIVQCLTWLAFTLLGGLMPLWGTYILTQIGNKSSTLYDYVGRAEFALYAAATASAALFVVFRDFKAPFPLRSQLGLLFIGFLLIASVLFAGVFSSAPPDPQNSPGSLNIGLLAWLSIGTFAVATVLAVVVFLVDLQVAEFDPRSFEKTQLDALSKAVENEQ